MRLRRTVRNAWIEALRSDEYQQAKGGLQVFAPDGRTAIGHCCLGVGCELAKAAGVPVHKGTPMRDGLSNSRALYMPYDGEISFPPAAVAEWMTGDPEEGDGWQVRLPSEDDTPVDFEYVGLAEANDSGSTFGDIADLLENDLDAEDDIRDDLAEVTS